MVGPPAAKRGRAESPKKEPTMTDLYRLVEKNQNTLEDNTTQLNSIATRMKRMENRLDNVEDRVTELEKGNEDTCSMQEMKKTVKELRHEMAEQKLKFFKKDNAMIYGIAETSDGDVLYKELMAILLPGSIDDLVVERVGKVSEGSSENSSKPRPILLRTGNSNIKKKMFGNLKKLKGVEKFKYVSVQHDYIRAQRSTRKRKITDSSAAGNGDSQAENQNTEKRVGVTTRSQKANSDEVEEAAKQPETSEVSSDTSGEKMQQD